MAVEFAYAQARAQAHHGARLSPESWHMLESSPALPQYLHALRATPLAARVQHFSPASSPHDIERSLRGDWRAAVENASHWVPASWRAAVAWIAWLPDLAAIAHLLDGGHDLPWMHEDPVLAVFAALERESRHGVIRESQPGKSLMAQGETDLWSGWTSHWQSLWPHAAGGDEGLREFVGLLVRYRRALGDPALEPDAVPDLDEAGERRVLRLFRSRTQQPVTIFCHLYLTALEFRRLRRGLVRRALFNDVVPEALP